LGLPVTFVKQSFGPQAFARLVSSEELSQCLRQIDGRQMAVIIDPCHSASVMDQPGYKPVPMGDTVRVKLAGDKGMMILAATWASDVVLAVQKIEQGC
jgi:hypothetical protein